MKPIKNDWKKNNRMIKKWIKDNGEWGKIIKWFLQLNLNENVLNIRLIDFEYGTVIIRYLEFCLYKVGIPYWKERGINDAVYYTFLLEDLSKKDVECLLKILDNVCEYSDADYYYEGNKDF